MDKERAGIKTEAESISEEQRAEAISCVIDRRDVPGRETALHLAVRMRDAQAAEMLMAAGADWRFRARRCLRTDLSLRY